ncbi:intraflagellar transport protein 74 homolog [Atheta coriaria]|uniref:intraflagellar transport protein 74 homolog n=1 Tax=Dalotia coriaria TaxID=877792 RepID=UPI0031F42444
MQKTELEAFVQNTLTPAQQREKLLEQVKQDKADIESLLKVKTSVEEELSNNETRLGELEHELDGKDNARLKKHKELRERGEHMEKFISEYEIKSVDLKTKIQSLNQEIGIALEHMSENLAEVNLKELDVKFNTSEHNTLEGWSNKYKLLTTQITRISAVRQKYQKEISDMREKMVKMQGEMQLYGDIGKGKMIQEAKKEQLLEKQRQLQNTLDSTRMAVVEAKKKREDMKRRIEENDDFNEIMKLEKTIENVEMEANELENAIKAESSNEEMDNLWVQLHEVLAKRNAQLIDNLKKNGRKNFE